MMNMALGKLRIALLVTATSVAIMSVGGAHATTGPEPHTLVNVSINDVRTTLSKYNVKNVTFVDFYIHNTGKLPHNFVIGTQKSRTLRPGERLHFYVGFPVFGYYHYKTTLNGKPGMRGKFHIDTPQLPD